MKKNIKKIVLSVALLVVFCACGIQNTTSSHSNVQRQNQSQSSLENLKFLLFTNNFAEIKKICDVDPALCATQKDAAGATLLTVAIQQKNYDIATYLATLDKNSLNQVNNDGKNPVFFAVRESNLIANNEDPEPKEDFALSLIDIASKEQLLAKDNTNSSVASYALSSDVNIKFAQKICERFPDICADKDLLLSSMKGSHAHEIKKLLIDNYVKINNDLPDDVDKDGNNIAAKVFNGSLFTDHERDFAKYLIEKTDNIKLFTHKNKVSEIALSQLIKSEGLWSKNFDITSKLLTKFPALIHEPFEYVSYFFTDKQIKTANLLQRARDTDPFSNNLDTNLKIAIFEAQYPSFKDISPLQQEITLEENNWFVQLYENNPFKDLSINHPRPNMWGFALNKKEEADGHVVYQKSAELLDITEKEIPQDEFTSFADQITDAHKIAEGIYSIQMNGEDFVIKTTKTNLKNEYFNLERLQFTNSVVKTYGYFTHGEDKYMILEKGQKSLFATIKEGVDIDTQILIEGADNLIKLNNALGFLKIKLNDIKPGNLILTYDNQIKAIDLDTSDQLRYTKGYVGSSGRLFAQSLMEAFLKRFIGEQDSGSFKTILNNEIKPKNPDLAKKLLELYKS